MNHIPANGATVDGIPVNGKTVVMVCPLTAKTNGMAASSINAIRKIFIIHCTTATLSDS